MSDDKELVSKDFGEGEFDLVWDKDEKKLKVTLGYDGKGVDAGVYVNLEPEYFLDKLAEAIPGTVDDTVIALLKAAF